MIGLRRWVGRTGLGERDGFERRWWFFAGVWLVFLVDPLSSLWGPHHSIVQQLFGSVLIALISTMVLGYLIFQLVAPGVFGASGSRVDTLSSIIDSVYIVGATAFIFFSHQALAPATLRLLSRGSSAPSSAVNVEE